MGEVSSSENLAERYMVICKDTSSSSASSYIGHSSMMKDYSLPSNIYEKPMYESMITSYPLEKNMKWLQRQMLIQQ